MVNLGALKFGGTVTGMMVRPGHHTSPLQHLVIALHHAGCSDARWSRKPGNKSSEPWRPWRCLCGVFLVRDVCLRHLARNWPFSLLPSSTYNRIGNIRGRWYRGKHNKKLKPRHQCPPDHSGTNPVTGYIFGVRIKMHVYTDT